MLSHALLITQRLGRTEMRGCDWQDGGGGCSKQFVTAIAPRDCAVGLPQFTPPFSGVRGAEIVGTIEGVDKWLPQK